MFVEKVEVKVSLGFSENCYLVSEKRGDSSVLVVDPGAQPQMIRGALNGRSVDSVVLTHRHFDHVGAVSAIINDTGTEVIAHTIEAEALEGLIGVGPQGRHDTPDPFNVDRTVDEGDMIKVGDSVLRVLHTPGHTAGSICLYDEDDHLLLAGDTLFYEDVGRTDFPSGSKAQQDESLKRLCHLPDDTIIYPGHGPDTSIGHEKRCGPMARFIR